MVLLISASWIARITGVSPVYGLIYSPCTHFLFFCLGIEEGIHMNDAWGKIIQRTLKFGLSGFISGGGKVIYNSIECVCRVIGTLQFRRSIFCLSIMTASFIPTLKNVTESVTRYGQGNSAYSLYPACLLIRKQAVKSAWVLTTGPSFSSFLQRTHLLRVFSRKETMVSLSFSNYKNKPNLLYSVLGEANFIFFRFSCARICRSMLVESGDGRRRLWEVRHKAERGVECANTAVVTPFERTLAGTELRKLMWQVLTRARGWEG
jgi:hypothetical protein